MISLWTVYENPSDYRGRIVARRFENMTPTADVIVGDSFEAVSAAIPGRASLVWLPRMPGDDPCIVGTWL